jgi:hypothetical protein
MRIQNTLVYTQLIKFKDDEYTSKVAQDAKETIPLERQTLNTTPKHLTLFPKCT